MSDDDQPSAIIGTTTTIKTLVDGTFRVSIDISPVDAQAAFALFGRPGTPVALARLMPVVALTRAREETIERAKGGALAKLAGQFCGAPQFLEWMRLTYDPLPRNAEDAAQIIRQVCQIESRAELDHSDLAASLFHNVFRIPYNEWLKQNG
jgi:hypothetical protein